MWYEIRSRISERRAGLPSGNQSSNATGSMSASASCKRTAGIVLIGVIDRTAEVPSVRIQSAFSADAILKFEMLVHVQGDARPSRTACEVSRYVLAHSGSWQTCGGVLFSDRGPRLEGKEDAIFPNITASRAPISPAKLQMDATSEERVRRVDQRDWSQQERGELDGSGGLRGQTL